MRTRLGLLGFGLVKAPGHARLDAGGGVLVHRACRGDLVEPLGQKPELLGSLGSIAFGDSIKKMLCLCLNHTLTSAINSVSLSVLSYSFLG